MTTGDAPRKERHLWNLHDLWDAFLAVEAERDEARTALVAALDERDAARAENARLKGVLAPLVEYAPLGQDDDCRYCYRIDPAREGHAHDCEWDIARRALAGEPAE